MSQSRITISGYYGFDNAGDEAVLAGLVQAFGHAGRSNPPKLTALSIAPEATQRSHGIAAAHRYKIGPLLSAIKGCDLFLSGGGSLLQDVTSAHGIFYYCGVVRLAQILGKRTMFIAQGIGPLLRPRSQKLVAGVANRLHAITVRDPESADLLLGIGVQQRIQLTADPALILAMGARSRPGSGPVTVSLRTWADADQSLPATLAQACATAFSDVPMGTLAMQPALDSAPLEQFRREWHQSTGQQATEFAVSAPATDRVPEIVQHLAASRLVVGMRLHALILAASAGIPSVALAYDPKIQSFMRSTGQEDAVVDLRADAETLRATIAQVAADLPGRTDRLRQRLPALREAAMRNAEVALDLLS